MEKLLDLPAVAEILGISPVTAKIWLPSAVSLLSRSAV
jgi:hypothetical protein